MRLDDTTRELLDGPHYAVLATPNANGQPQSSVIFVLRDGDTVLFSTIRGRLKTRNMERDGRVSLLILHKETGQYMEIRGSVRITDDPEGTFHEEMYARYMNGATPPPEPGASRVTVRITPEKLTTYR